MPWSPGEPWAWAAPWPDCCCRKGAGWPWWTSAKRTWPRPSTTSPTTGKRLSYVCDISDREKVYDLAGRVAREFGAIDILVNNAGIVKSHPFLEKPDELIERTIAVNLMAQFWTMKAFLPGMVEKKEGHVVNMASAGGLLGVPYISDYAASKFAVVGLTESLRQEFKLRGLRKVRFTYVCPNTVNTGMFAGATRVKGTKHADRR